MKKAPNFTLYDEESNPHVLSDYKGHKVVLYFYPKDMTSGCTLEAQGFRDLWLEFVSLDVHIFGISPDDVKSHKKFCQKEELTFPLLADTDHKVAELYGAWDGKISLTVNGSYGINSSGTGTFGTVGMTSLTQGFSTRIDYSGNGSFAALTATGNLTWSGQTRGPYTADTGLSFASSAGKIAYYDTAGNFKGWIPVLP